MRLYLSSFRNGNKPEELLKLLGNGRRTAFIPNAIDFGEPERRAKGISDEIERLKSMGLDPEEVDLRQYFGKSDELAQKLKEFDLIWVRGGNAFILRRAYKQSGVDQIISRMLSNDEIVYGGYSAGIDMLTPDLHGVEIVDDPHTVLEGYDEEIVWECLNVLPYAIAPHYKSDHPESEAVGKSVEYYIDHHVPFIALRDGEAIVVDGKSQEIVG